jgi:hypothetical protein
MRADRGHVRETRPAGAWFQTKMRIGTARTYQSNGRLAAGEAVMSVIRG